jgi:hypothetical protein
MNKFVRYTISGLVMGMLALLLAPPSLAQQTQTIEPIITVSPVRWFADQVEIEGAEAILTRMEHGISMTLSTTGLNPGDAYTAWWMIFNLPENCSAPDCGMNDVFVMDENNHFILDGNGNKQLNRPTIEAAQISSLWAASNIVYADGTVNFEGRLPIGDTTGDVWFGHGLVDPMHAVIHIITRTHGPTIEGLLDEQLFTMMGGCQPRINEVGCDNNQVAIFEAPEQ